MSEKILVIRLGALGDLVLCCEAFAAIRAAHPKAEIALLTMPAFVGFAQSMPWFDRVIVDARAPAGDMAGWLKLARDVRAFGPTRVYDLQGKFRQTILYVLLGGPLGVEWSGAAPLCKFPRQWPPTPDMHFTDFVAAQLARAHINPRVGIQMDWLAAPVERFALPSRYLMLIPGCAPDRLYKRWPAENYATLANKFAAESIAAIAIGTKHDAPAVAAIHETAPQVIDLCGQTSLAEVASLARGAVCAIGNDTGPTHLAAAAGAPTITLMSDRVSPVWSAPKGRKAKVLQGSPLEKLVVDDVVRTVQEMME